MKMQTKHPVEVKGTMSPKGADRVGMLMAVATVIDKLLWKAIILITFAGLALSGAYTYRTSLSGITVGYNRVEAPHVCGGFYEPYSQSVELKPLNPKQTEITPE